MLISLITLNLSGQSINIKTGIEVLKQQNFKILEGKRVGLITNPTGVDNQMKSTIDILFEAPNVNLVALYAPEHGVRGDAHAGDQWMMKGMPEQVCRCIRSTGKHVNLCLKC